MLPGDLLLCRSTGPVGWLIRFGERVRYYGWWRSLGWLARAILRLNPPDEPDEPAWGNHIAIHIGDGLVVEALAQGVVVTPLAHYQAGRYRVVRLAACRPAVTDVERAAAVAFAREMAARHAKYGWLSIASIILQLVTPVRLDVSFDGAVICSALGAQAWEHAGVILPTLSSLTTMPADFWRWTDPARPPAQIIQLPVPHPARKAA